jgi:phosphate transport system permease protein
LIRTIRRIRTDFLRRPRAFLFTRATQLGAFAVCAFLFFVVAVLAYKSSLLLRHESIIDLLLSSEWNPMRGQFGFFPIIVGSVYVTGLAMLLAIPVSVLSSIYVAEYLRGRFKHVLKSFVDVLAGIPSVVYGMCAIIVLVPLVRDGVAPLFGIDSTGFCVFSAALVLAVMVFPIIISVCVDVFRAVPQETREASLAVGATKWQTTKLVVFRAALPGVFSAVLLGFGRAFGETIAVAMLVGNLPRIPASLFDSGTTLPAIIASTYGELMSVPRYDAAMMLLALILILIVLLFNYVARSIKKRFEKSQLGESA